MSIKEKEDLIKQAVSYIEKTSTTKWVDSFFKDLKIAYKPKPVCLYLGDKNTPDLRRAIHFKNDLRRLNIFECDSEFFDSNKCLIFLDHEAIPILEYSKETMTPTK